MESGYYEPPAVTTLGSLYELTAGSIDEIDLDGDFPTLDSPLT